MAQLPLTPAMPSASQPTDPSQAGQDPLAQLLAMLKPQPVASPGQPAPVNLFGAGGDPNAQGGMGQKAGPLQTAFGNAIGQGVTSGAKALFGFLGL